MSDLVARLRGSRAVWNDARAVPTDLETEAADRLTLCETALRAIREAIPKYLKGEMSEHDFALLVLGEADSSIVNKALEKGR